MDELMRTVKSVLPTTPARWISLTQNTPASLLTLAPAPGEWSALECLQHILDTESVFQFRLKAFLDGVDFPAFNPATQGSKPDPDWSPVMYAEEFSRRRAESLAALEKLNQADLARRARHQELGMVTLSEMIHEWVAHDLNHTVQAERALMQPFITGCGPWNVYFTDHMVKAH